MDSRVQTGSYMVPDGSHDFFEFGSGRNIDEGYTLLPAEGTHVSRYNRMAAYGETVASRNRKRDKASRAKAGRNVQAHAAATTQRGYGRTVAPPAKKDGAKARPRRTLGSRTRSMSPDRTPRTRATPGRRKSVDNGAISPNVHMNSYRKIEQSRFRASQFKEQQVELSETQSRLRTALQELKLTRLQLQEQAVENKRLKFRVKQVLRVTRDLLHMVSGTTARSGQQDRIEQLLDRVTNEYGDASTVLGLGSGLDAGIQQHKPYQTSGPTLGRRHSADRTHSPTFLGSHANGSMYGGGGLPGGRSASPLQESMSRLARLLDENREVEVTSRSQNGVAPRDTSRSPAALTSISRMGPGPDLSPPTQYPPRHHRSASPGPFGQSPQRPESALDRMTASLYGRDRPGATSGTPALSHVPPPDSTVYRQQLDGDVGTPSSSRLGGGGGGAPQIHSQIAARMQEIERLSRPTSAANSAAPSGRTGPGTGGAGYGTGGAEYGTGGVGYGTGSGGVGSSRVPSSGGLLMDTSSTYTGASSLIRSNAHKPSFGSGAGSQLSRPTTGLGGSGTGTASRPGLSNSALRASSVPRDQDRNQDLLKDARAMLYGSRPATSTAGLTSTTVPSARPSAGQQPRPPSGPPPSVPTGSAMSVGSAPQAGPTDASADSASMFSSVSQSRGAGGHRPLWNATPQTGSLFADSPPAATATAASTTSTQRNHGPQAQAINGRFDHIAGELKVRPSGPGRGNGMYGRDVASAYGSRAGDLTSHGSGYSAHEPTPASAPRGLSGSLAAAYGGGRAAGQGPDQSGASSLRGRLLGGGSENAQSSPRRASPGRRPPPPPRDMTGPSGPATSSGMSQPPPPSSRPPMGQPPAPTSTATTAVGRAQTTLPNFASPIAPASTLMRRRF